jgi:hypothetical protein
MVLHPRREEPSARPCALVPVRGGVARCPTLRFRTTRNAIAIAARTDHDLSFREDSGNLVACFLARPRTLGCPRCACAPRRSDNGSMSDMFRQWIRLSRSEPFGKAGEDEGKAKEYQASLQQFEELLDAALAAATRATSAPSAANSPLQGSRPECLLDLPAHLFQIDPDSPKGFCVLNRVIGERASPDHSDDLRADRMELDPQSSEGSGAATRSFPKEP